MIRHLIRHFYRFSAPPLGGGGLSYGGYGLYLKLAIFKFIAFSLNQPSPTNQLQFFPILCDHHGMKRLLPVLMGFGVLIF